MGGTLRGPRTLLILTLLFAVIPCVSAQEASSEESNIKFESITETAPGLRTLVSIDAEDTYLPSVLSILAAKSGFNIVTGPGVSKEERISIHLKDAPIEEAMNLTVRAAGLSYEIIGNSFLVATSKKLKEQVGLNSYVIPLQYADAEEVKKLLGDFSARIQIDKSGNKLLIITTPKVITDIERVISSVDKPALQITLSARLIEVSVEDEERLGINWSKLSTNMSWFIYEGAGSPSSSAGGGETGGGTSSQSQTGMRTTGPFERFEGISDVGKTFWRSQVVQEIALDWMLKNSRAEILTNTSITTMNNRPAEIALVDRVSYVASAGGVGGSVNVKSEDIGIKLRILPQVNTDGYITVTVEPEVSSLFEFIGPDQTVPRIVSRNALLTVRVKDHQTIIVGGLMSLTSSKTEHKVPFFGDIPYLGSLFRYKVVNNKKTDLIMEITPHILVDEYTYIEKSDKVDESYEMYKKEMNFELSKDSDIDEDK
ncbi:MAG: secretin N-terminal domain-containing protein [Candidatus Hatepunaea meridiana]|nr:secretin N-terminal domain-containing protein [Candidatus Hatepunaea meridiana]